MSLDAPVSELTTAQVVDGDGRPAGRRYRRFRGRGEPGAAQARGVELHASHGVGFDDVSFQVRAGEVLGLYGKIGSGVAEVAEALFGARRLTSGHVDIERDELHGCAAPAEAIAAGIGYLPPDRRGRRSCAPGRSLRTSRHRAGARLARQGSCITQAQDAQAYRRWHDVLGVRSRNDPAQYIGTLSGGNQQKVLLGRWLEAGSKVLILTEPTRGVDVGARQEIYTSSASWPTAEAPSSSPPPTTRTSSPSPTSRIVLIRGRSSPASPATT